MLTRWRGTTHGHDSVIAASSSNQRDMWLQEHQRKQMRINLESLNTFTTEYMLQMMRREMRQLFGDVGQARVSMETWRALNGG
jgi:hypothetical protein